MSTSAAAIPSLYAAELAANEPMRAAPCARSPPRGAPIYAECGGLMYLSDAVRTLDGSTHEMVGLVAGTAVMHDRLQALGYVEVETQRRTLLGGAGLRMRGHQFRYSTLEGGRGDAYSVIRRTGWRLRRVRGLWHAATCSAATCTCTGRPTRWWPKASCRAASRFGEDPT